ncbi:MAG: phosphatidylserine decarboxylase family protein [Anaerolineae bacterium]|nr:phosphatidylserine decarboxylase family protein [Anaerolineae bacterium]
MQRPRYDFPLARGAGKELAIIGLPLVAFWVASIIRPRFYTILPALLLLPVFGLLLYFFRNPQRRPAGEGEDVFLSPADGTVMEVERGPAPRLIEGETLKIGIFMSIFDVHVNRAPSEGKVVLVEHVPGRFVRAYRPEASEVNEHNFIGLATSHGPILVKQISGALARRIVCWVKTGEQLRQGQRLGVIKFGSRVDIYLPPTAEPAVQVGEHVLAGTTVIARWEKQTT